MHIANNIKRLRKRFNLTQNELATRIDKVPVTVSDYEKGKTVPPIEIAVKLCDIFQVNLDDLVNKDLSKESPESPEETKGGELSAKSKELLFHLLVLKIKELSREIEQNNKEKYYDLGLDKLLKAVEEM